MSISAISSVYSSYQRYQTQIFGGSISESQFEFLMRKYGITATGDTQKDVEALYKAMYSDADTEVAGSIASQNAAQQSQSTQAQQANQIPWANLMSRVGLAATGDLADDYALFSAKVSQMKASGASSPQDKALIAQLSAEASIVFVQPQSDSQAQANAQTLSGADIKALLNKLYFFS